MNQKESKLVYLDFDWVLIWKTRDLDPVCGKNLKDIITRSRAEIVLSSDWRIDKHRKDVERIFDMIGLPVPTLRTDEDTDEDDHDRDVQIMKSLKDISKKRKIKSFVVLDDTVSYFFKTMPGNNNVCLDQCDFHSRIAFTEYGIGLTSIIRDQAISMLNKDLSKDELSSYFDFLASNSTSSIVS